MPKKFGKIAVVGPNADNDLAQLGDWSLGSSQYPPAKGKQPRACTITLLDGIRARLPASVTVSHAVGCSISSPDVSQIPAAVSACAGADLIVLVLGDDLPFIGEGHSTATLELLGGQLALLEAVLSLEKPIVLALVNSKPLVLPPATERVAAIIECFNPGMAGGAAFAEALFGDLIRRADSRSRFRSTWGSNLVFTIRPPVNTARSTPISTKRRALFSVLA